jgi:hypothetical protein
MMHHQLSLINMLFGHLLVTQWSLSGHFYILIKQAIKWRDYEECDKTNKKES